MTRFLALFLLAATTPLSAAGLPRNFTVTSFERIRVEGAYAVSVATNRPPSARAEGSAAALDAIDLRVEGTTLIIRQRSGAATGGSGEPVRIAVSTPVLSRAILSGAGSLAIDRMTGLTADVAVQGPGMLSVRAMTADRVNGSAQGSGTLRLAGKTEKASYLILGSATLAADTLVADDATLTAEATGEVAVAARDRATVNAGGIVQVRVSGNPTCVVRAAGSASVTGCRTAR